MYKGHYKLFQNCLPVMGANRSVLCDLQQNTYELIPNTLFKILTSETHLSIQELINKYPDNEKVIGEYFQMLFQNGYIFEYDVDYPNEFPPMNMDWKSPYTINNAILDWDKNSNYNVPLVLSELNDLKCKQIQLRFYDPIKISLLQTYLKSVNDSVINGIEVYIPYIEEDQEKFIELIKKHPRITVLTFHSAPETKLIIEGQYNIGVVLMTKNQITDNMHCGNISPDYFTMNPRFFTESLQFNNCLNRKIGIDAKGNIKNCPTMQKSYGKVNEIKIKNIVLDKNYQKLWSIKKDDISVCKDCEFRYICLDCRAFQSSENAIRNNKPVKCSYNPYDNTWE